MNSSGEPYLGAVQKDHVPNANQAYRQGVAANNGVPAAHSSRGSETAGAVSLPPLRRTGELSESGAHAAASSNSPGSPMRRARKAELMSYALGRNPNTTGGCTSAGLLLDLETMQQQMAAAAGQQQDLGRLALETWVDDMLKSTQPATATKQRPGSAQLQQLAESGGARGAAAVGLSRQQLVATGMSNAAVDQLYRSLFVYSVGFFDTLKEVLLHNSHKQELLYTIWKTFLSLAENAMKATFKSEYLSLVEAAGTAMAELMSSKHALAEARRDNATMVKDLGWLSAAEAEAAAARRGLKSQVQDLQSGLSLEQKAHQHAVKQYVDALDAKSALQLQFQDSQQQLDQLKAAHDLLRQQHQQLRGQYDTLVGQCRVVRDVCKHVDNALSLDTQLVQSVQQQKQPQHQQQTTGQSSRPSSAHAAEGAQQLLEDQPILQPDASEAAPNQPQPPAATAVDDATDLQPLAQRLQQQVEVMYSQWRSAVDARAVALTENFRMGDELRAAKEETYQQGQKLQVVQKAHDHMEAQLTHSQATAADLEKRLLAAHDAVAKHLLDLGETQGLLQQSRVKVDSLEERCSQLEETLRDTRDDVAALTRERNKLEQQLQQAGERFARKHRLMAKVSKGFSVAMQSLWAQQTGRGVLRRLLEAERQKGAHLGSSLEGKDARLHDLDATVVDQQNRIGRLQTELSLLESGLADSQKQAMSLGAKLTLSDAKNEELLTQIQGQQEQIKEVTTKLNKTTTKLEVMQGQLDKAYRDIKDLREGALVAERQLADAHLANKSLTADVERLTREKKDLGDRADATKARLQLEIQRLSGELHAAEHKLELLGADLGAERDRVAATQALLERKRVKKRRWKTAYSDATCEVESLHKQLLSKQKELEALETRIKRLETELKVLSAVNTVRLPAAAAGAAAQAGSRPTSAHAVVVVDVDAARKAHETATADVTSLGQECLDLDSKIEDLELAQQQLLLKLATPDLSKDDISNIRSAAAAKLRELKQLRQQRDGVEAKRGEAASRMRAAEAALREAHQQRLLQRQRLLEQQALQTTDLANAAALGQLAAAEAAEVAIRDQLSQQLDAFEAAQADKAAMSQRLGDLQAGIDKFMVRITDLQNEKTQLEEKLQRANTMINFLQVEISNLKAERERIKVYASDSDNRIAALEKELEKAKQSVSAALKGLEAKHQADKLMHEQKQVHERAKSAQHSRAQEQVLAALRSKCAQLQESLQYMAAEAWALKTGIRQPPKADVCAVSDQTGSRSGSAELVAAPVSGSKAACLSLSDTGAGGGDGALGVRWLYQHQMAGPWVSARAVLKESAAANAAAAGGLSPRPEVTPDGIRRLGAPTANPCGLPGLGFNPDSLAVLLAELILDKIAADRFADAQAASTATSAGQSGSEAEVESEEQLTANAKGAAAVKAWWTARNRKDLEGTVFDFFLSRFGCRLAADTHCTALVGGLRKAAARNKRARLFGRCLGLIEPVVPLPGVGTLMHLMAQLHSLCGPLTGEATEGSSQVVARTAVQVVADLLNPTLAPACQELSELSSAIIDAAGGHSDNSIEVDDLLELALSAWQAQYAADERQFEMLFKGVDSQGRGLVVLDEFMALVKQVNTGAAAALSQEQYNTLFATALKASGPGATALSGTGCATAILGAGLVGCAAHLRPHPVITSRPPFSDYRLLNDSWHGVKPALQELLCTLPKRNPQLTQEASVMSAQVKKLDDSLEGCAPAAEVWQCYRRILGFYSQHGRFVDVVPAVPVSGSGTPRNLLSAGANTSDASSFLGGPNAAVESDSLSGDVVAMDSPAGVSSLGGQSTGWGIDNSSSRAGSLSMEPVLSSAASVGIDNASRPGSALIAASAAGSRPASAGFGAAGQLGSRPGSPPLAAASGTSTPAGSRPGSAGGPGLKLPLAAALLRPGSALSRPGSSPRGAAGYLSASRPASANSPSK